MVDPCPCGGVPGGPASPVEEDCGRSSSSCAACVDAAKRRRPGWSCGGSAAASGSLLLAAPVSAAAKGMCSAGAARCSPLSCSSDPPNRFPRGKRRPSWRGSGGPVWSNMESEDRAERVPPVPESASKSDNTSWCCVTGTTREVPAGKSALFGRRSGKTPRSGTQQCVTPAFHLPSAASSRSAASTRPTARRCTSVVPSARSRHDSEAASRSAAGAAAMRRSRSETSLSRRGCCKRRSRIRAASEGAEERATPGSTPELSATSLASAVALSRSDGGSVGPSTSFGCAMHGPGKR